jgi:hypothetical protein
MAMSKTVKSWRVAQVFYSICAESFESANEGTAPTEQANRELREMMRSK